ncbi:MAG: hypothetical protein HFG98_09675 [Dorea sp.]|nr:hypothetical protein [Dorea sp.]
MEIKGYLYKKLTLEMSDDFLCYFDNDAFSDHEEWSACYCLQSHLSREEDAECILKEERRRKAEELVRQGVMTGYLVYDGGRVVGWCNAGDKSGYGPVCEDEDFFTDRVEKGKIKVLYCMDIAPGYREGGSRKPSWKEFWQMQKRKGIPMWRDIPSLIQNAATSTEGRSGSMKNTDLSFTENRIGFSL